MLHRQCCRSRWCCSSIRCERPGTHCRVVTADASGKEGIPTNSCVSETSRKVLKRVATFRRCDAGIASVRSWTDRLRSKQGTKMDEQEAKNQRLGYWFSWK